MGLKKIKKVKRNYLKLRSRSFCRNVTCSIYKQLMKNDYFRKIEIIVVCLRSYLWKRSWVPGYRISCSSHENQATGKGIKNKEKKLLTFLTLCSKKAKTEHNVTFLCNFMCFRLCVAGRTFEKGPGYLVIWLVAAQKLKKKNC